MPCETEKPFSVKRNKDGVIWALSYNQQRGLRHKPKGQKVAQLRQRGQEAKVNPAMIDATTVARGTTQPLDQYLAALNPNRVGFPYCPLPLPFHNEPVFNSNDQLFSQQVDYHQSKLIEILDRYTHCSWQDIISSLQWRSPKESEKRRTLTIPVIEKLGQNQWLEAAKEIRQLLTSANNLDVQIEIYNSEELHFQEITNEPPSEEDKETYKTIEPYLFNVLEQHLPYSWRDYGLFMCKDRALKKKTKKIPLVVIFVQENSVCDWNKVAAEITQALRGNFEWRFQPGYYTSLSPPHTVKRFKDDGEFSTQVESGSTITSAANDRSQGTIGIFVDLEVSADSSSVYGLSPGTHKAVITCHHCIAPMVGSPTDPGTIFTRGYSLSTDDDSARYVSYPGKGDLSSSIHNLEHEIKDLTNKVNDEKKLYYQGSRYDEICETAKAIRLLESEKTRKKKILQRCWGLFRNGPIGRVLISSGIQVSDHYGCNLAVRACLSHPSDSIKLATFDDNCSRHHRHHLHDFAVVRLSDGICAVNIAPSQSLVPLARTIYRTGSPVIDSFVYKQGGRTGATKGKVKDFALVNRKDEFPNSSNIDGQSLNTILTRFRAWRVISEDQSSAFSDEGDSASGVNNAEVQLVGQIHSGFCDGSSVPVTYMNAIHDVFRDAEEKMSGISISLSLPELSMLGWIAEVLGFVDQVSHEPERGSGYV